MKYPKEYLDEIKLRLKVSQVIGKTVQLKKRGKEFVGLSPFKNEKSPSFTVSDEKEFYHCFSTGEHGNIFDFLMKTKSIGFGEAVKILAGEAGMQPYRFSNFDKEKEKKFIKYKNIYKDYLNFFHQELFNVKNQEALDYLKKRKLETKIIKDFMLGYVPWKNNFYQELLKKYSEEEINSTGLYYKNDKTGKYVDRFNSRIVFPINNLIGDPVAFGGRIIKESKLAKYINSPETEFYKKGRMIFNLDKAKSMRPMTNEVIIVEGYMDVVSLYSKGIKNVISNSGTALTESQIELIWKFFSDPILCLDGDESGQKAALRIAQRLFPLINENNKIYFSILTKGDDPDDYINKNGKEKFISLLSEKKIIQSYIWDLYSAQVNASDPYAISKFEKEIKKLCYLIKDETLRKYILEDFLEKLKQLTPIQNIKKKYTPYNKYKKDDYKILKETGKIFRDKEHLSKEYIKEYSILFIMIHYSNIAEKKIQDLKNLNITLENGENLKNEILTYIVDGFEAKKIETIIKKNHSDFYLEINKNTSLIEIIEKKKNEEKLELLNELIFDLKEMNHLEKIKFLEQKIAKNLDEASFSELIKLKSQLN
jgi:DNA primase